MDIHKPKAARNLREFAVEILTIVVGVIIAISLEQFVEYLHWHREVQIGRQALSEEIAIIDQFYARRIMIAPCIDRQLNDDAARSGTLRQTARSRSRPSWPPVVRPAPCSVMRNGSPSGPRRPSPISRAGSWR